MLESYPYDDADNMLTKAEPFAENFDDGYYARVFPVFVDTSNYVELRLAPNGMSLRKRVAGTETVLDSDAGAATAADTWYTVRMRMDDAAGQHTVERAAEGGLFAPVLSHASAFGLGANNAMRFHVRANALFAFDDIEVRDGGMANTTTFSYNAANELTKMNDPYGGETTFTYDGFGRMVTKALEENDTDTFSAVYTYGYGSMLTNVDTDIPGERDVSYVYGGDGMRRQRTSVGVTTKYNWLNDENASGDLTTSYVMGLAEIAGSNPATGAFAYMLPEANGSPRAILDAGKAHLAQYEFTPYGRTLSQSGEAFNSLYTGHEWDGAAGLYLAPFRVYSAALSRWTTRDPLHMVNGPNLYAYVISNPTSYIDPLGLSFMSVAACFGKGLLLGAAGAGLVAGAIILAPAWVPTGFISGGLLMAGGIGGYVTIRDAYKDRSPENIASIVGGVLGGGAVGGRFVGAIGSRLGPKSTPGAWSPTKDAKNVYDPRKGLNPIPWISDPPDHANAVIATSVRGTGPGSKGC